MINVIDTVVDGEDGIVFYRTRAGEPVFSRAYATDAYGSVRFMEWNPSELRVIADYMDKNPQQRCMNDGSGMMTLTDKPKRY